MSRLSRIVVLVAALALALAFGQATASAHHRAPRIPSGARAPVTSTWVDVRFSKSRGVSFGCVVLDENPFGYYTVMRRLAGYTFVDKNRASYVSWYANADGRIVVGPRDVHIDTTYVVCGWK